jgi:hypothetical protein
MMPWGTFTYGPISPARSSHSVTYQYEWSIYKPFALQYAYSDIDKDGRVIVTTLEKCVMTREFLLKFFQEIMERLQIKKDMARMKRMMNKGKKNGSEEDGSEEDENEDEKNKDDED